jgi:FdhE protein
VPAEFLHNLLGRSASLPPEVQAAIEELAQLGRERPSLAEPAALLADVLPIVCTDGSGEPPPEITRQQAVAKLAGGVPLLRGEPLSFDAKAFRRRWQQVCSAIQRHQPGDAPQALADSVRRGRLDPEDWLREMLAGRPEAVHARAAGLGLDAGLAGSVLRFSSMPVLTRANAALESLRSGVPWEGGHCPTCGNGPLLGEYRGLEQSRFLRCGFCAADWAFPRLRCPHCGERDHHKLGFFSVEGEEGKYRAAVCDACRGYVKMLSTLTCLSGPRLVVGDLATLHLDLAALERGYAN